MTEFEKNEIGKAVDTIEEAIQTVIRIASGEIGYLEKVSLDELDSKTANAGYGNYTKYWRDIDPEFQGNSWSACFVTWVLVKAFGIEKTRTLLKDCYPYTYVPALANRFIKYANPQAGDIVMFYNGSEFYHTGLVIEVDGDQFVTIEGNTNSGSGVESDGGGVFRKIHCISGLPGTKFVRPDYGLVVSKSDVFSESSVLHSRG